MRFLQQQFDNEHGVRITLLPIPDPPRWYGSDHLDACIYVDKNGVEIVGDWPKIFTVSDMEDFIATLHYAGQIHNALLLSSSLHHPRLPQSPPCVTEQK